MSIKVILADDHVLMREGIRQLLTNDGGFEVIDEAGDGEECIEKLKHSDPQVLLLDISMPKKNGIKVLEEIKNINKCMKVLILTAHDEMEYLTQAVNLGADGYLLKESDFSELKKAIYTVMNGDTYIQPRLIPVFNAQVTAKKVDKDKIDLLTRRELQVLTQVANGMINKEIATLLNISERTVKNHISNIFSKIDVSDRTQAAVFAIRNNIVRL